MPTQRGAMMRTVSMASPCACMFAPARAPLPRGPLRSAALARPSLLVSSFTQPPCSLTSLCSSMSGMWIGQSSAARPGAGQGSRRGASVIVAVGGNSIGNTKGGTRRARTRTSGFRARTLTPGGRKVLKNRRKKGRHTLTPANNYKK